MPTKKKSLKKLATKKTKKQKKNPVAETLELLKQAEDLWFQVLQDRKNTLPSQIALRDYVEEDIRNVRYRIETFDYLVED